MNLLPMNAPIRRALTFDEVTTVLGEITAVEDSTELLPVVVVAVYDTLLADLGLSLATLPEGQQLDPRKFLIPARQWQVIAGAATGRAATLGSHPALGMDLINVLPGTYDDPGAPLPALPGTDRLDLEVSLSADAVEVITAAGRHLQALAAHYGPRSPQHVTAATTWLAGLAQVLSAGCGPQVRVVREGNLSLLVNTAGGYTFGVIFHGDTRRCTAGDGCTALIADDGTAQATYPTTSMAAHVHEPSFPLDAPRPGSWKVHS